jgi:hypothetical protein
MNTSSLAIENTINYGLVGAVFIFVIVLFSALGAIIYLLIRNEGHRLSTKEAREVLLHAEEKANEVISEATAEARKMRLKIEEDRVRALSEDSKEIEHFLDAYHFRLDKVVKELSYGIEKEHSRVTGKFVESLQHLEERVSENASQALKSMSTFSNQSGDLFKRLSYEIENVEKGIQHLALALEEAAANEADRNAEIVRKEMHKIGKETAAAVVKVAEGLDTALRMNLEEEFASISDEITKYREARMRLIDERILVLLEETTQIALQRKLNMQDQADLVHRSLEEAKQRGIFI